MKFSFLGNEGTATTVFLSRTWVKGVPQEVGDAGHVATLKAHPHFVEFGKAPPVAVVQPLPGAEPVVPHETQVEPAIIEPDDLTDEELEALTSPDAFATPEPKRRGRVPGSKNKPKVTDGDADNE